MRSFRVLLCLLALVAVLPACSNPSGIGEALNDYYHPDDAAGQLRRDVVTVCNLAPPRDHAHPENLEAVAQWIEARFVATGAAVSSQPYEAWGNDYRNVIARFGPADAKRVLVVGAHYDTDAEHATPGADDNASAVAVLLALADRLGAKPTSGEVAVELVAYTLEESPAFASNAMGSMRHAESLRERGIDVTGMICLEMLGYFSDKPGSQQYPLPELRETYPDAGNFIGVVGRPEDAALIEAVSGAMRSAGEIPPVETLAAPPELPGIALSDHRSYWEHGFTAVMITDTSYYRNPHYHQPTDTPDTLDYERMAGVLDQVEAAVRALARGE